MWGNILYIMLKFISSTNSLKFLGNLCVAFVFMLEGLARLFRKRHHMICLPMMWHPSFFFSSPKFLASMMLIIKCCAVTPLMAFPMSLWRSKVLHISFSWSMSSLDEVVVDLWLLRNTYPFFSFFCALYLKIQPTRFFGLVYIWIKILSCFHPNSWKVTMFVILLDIIYNTTKHWKEY